MGAGLGGGEARTVDERQRIARWSRFLRRDAGASAIGLVRAIESRDDSLLGQEPAVYSARMLRCRRTEAGWLRRDDLSP